jgi:hypothetical protein
VVVGVVVVRALNVVAVQPTAHGVLADVAVERVGARAAEDGIVAGRAVQAVVPSLPVEGVLEDGAVVRVRAAVPDVVDHSRPL